MLPEFVPGKTYDPQEIRRSLGAKAGEGSVVEGHEGVALFVRLGAPSGPSFPERSILDWPGEAPKQVVKSKSGVLVFVETGDKTVRFIGEGWVRSYSSGTTMPCDVQFEIRPSLSRSQWLELLEGNLPSAGPPPEAALARLVTDSSPLERWNALTIFLERWYGKSVTGTPSESKVGPPLLLKMLGAQAEIPEVFRHNQLVRPSELVLDDGKVVFLVENQGVCLWATEPEGEDPRVWYRNNEQGEPWIEEPQRLAGFLIQAVLFEAILHARFGASATELPADSVKEIVAQVEPLGGGRWNWGGARFFARDGALVITMENDGAGDVWLAARTPFALSRFEDVVTEDWDRVAF